MLAARSEAELTERETERDQSLVIPTQRTDSAPRVDLTGPSDRPAPLSNV
ncbi:hypothetical protein SALBM311S_02436 [Streptomyces alboniger]